jgi:undecaprenyl pyrophosphate phosphatase UppP
MFSSLRGRYTFSDVSFLLTIPAVLGAYSILTHRVYSSAWELLIFLISFGSAFTVVVLTGEDITSLFPTNDHVISS